MLSSSGENENFGKFINKRQEHRSYDAGMPEKSLKLGTASVYLYQYIRKVVIWEQLQIINVEKFCGLCMDLHANFNDFSGTPKYIFEV